MKKFLILFSILTLNSCSKNDIEPELLKIGIYPTFNKSIEAILDLDKKYIAVISPNSYELPPPPPLDENISEKEAEEQYKKYLLENPIFEPFSSNITENEVESLKKIILSFKETDFKPKNEPGPFDGTYANITIVYNDNSLKFINPKNNPKEKQAELVSEVYKLIKLKNKSKNNKIIFEK